MPPLSPSRQALPYMSSVPAAIVAVAAPALAASVVIVCSPRRASRRVAVVVAAAIGAKCTYAQCQRDHRSRCTAQVAVHPGYGPFTLALDGRLYAITMAHASMFSWKPGEPDWREEPSPPKGMAQMSGAVSEGVGYIIGQDGCFSYDPASGQWTELPSVPGGDLTAPHVAAHKGQIWACMDHTTRATAVFSPATKQWTVGPEAPTANGWGGAASIDGQLLVVSGAHSDELQGRVIFDDRCFILRE